MNVLVTSARLPVALDEIRKLGRRGHRVFAADTIRTAPGSHSRFVVARARVAPPAYQPERFLRDVRQLVRARAVELIVPCFEEVFYLTRHPGALPATAELFASEFELLSQLHDKGAFQALAHELGIPTPATVRVSSPAELRAAIAAFGDYVARPARSRGGIEVLANRGPLAGALAVDDVRPARARPWIVQEYVEGRDVCSFSIARHGRVVVHCAYVHPREIEHAGGIVFESIAEPATLAYAQRLVEATGYHGQIGLDFRQGSRGLLALECNPRPVAGVHLVPAELVVDAVTGAAAPSLRVAPAGVRRMYASAVLRDLLHHRDRFADDVAYLFSGTRDVYGEPDDLAPALFQVLSYVQVLAYRQRHGPPPRRLTALMAAYFDGIAWDGWAIP
jgi:predicted ATP-grasp superfamily ATP-dependent carboligase